LFVRELEFSAFGGILVTRTELVREIQFPNQLKNRESPAKRDLRFAPASFRTPKTLFQ
jgi:hypothetical protein